MVSVHTELTFGHLRYCFGDVPPQSNSAPGTVHDLEYPDVLLSSAYGVKVEQNCGRGPYGPSGTLLARREPRVRTARPEPRNGRDDRRLGLLPYGQE